MTAKTCSKEFNSLLILFRGPLEIPPSGHLLSQRGLSRPLILVSTLGISVPLRTHVHLYSRALIALCSFVLVVLPALGDFIDNSGCLAGSGGVIGVDSTIVGIGWC